MNPGNFLEKMDWLSSIIMGPYDPAMIGAVTVFDHEYCHGPSARYYWNPEDPVGGQYYHKDMNKLENLSEWVGSVAVPEGYTVELYDTRQAQEFK